MAAQIKPGVQPTAHRLYLLLISLAALGVGLFGITRLWVRAGVPFQCEDRGAFVIIAEVQAEARGLAEGDTLFAIDHKPIRRVAEIEFALDGRRAGENLAATILRQDNKISVPIVLGYYHTRRYVIITLVLGLFVWLIGAYVFLRKPGDKPALVFFCLALVLGVSIMISTARLPAGPRPWSYFLPVVYNSVYPFFPALFLRFAMIFPREKVVLHLPSLQTWLIYLPAMMFILLLQIFHLRALSSGDMELYREYHLVFTFHRGYLVVFFLLAMAALLHSYLAADSRSEKDKVRWILWGIAAGSAPFILLWTIPQILGKPPIVPEEVTYLALMVVPLTFAFAIVKYRILDIEVVINRSLVYALLTALIVGIYLALVGLAGTFFLTMSAKANSFIAILCTLIAAALFNPAKQRIQNFVDKTFYQIKYNYRLAIKEFGQSLMAATTQSEVLDLLLSKIHATVPVGKMVILLPRDHEFEIVATHGLNEEERRWLQSNELVRQIKPHPRPLARKGHADPWPAADRPGAAADWPALEALDRTGMELLLPVELSAGQCGILLLGAKLSGSKYLQEDVELLSTLSAEAFIALERIRFQEAAIREKAEREKAEELSRLKSEFVSLVSHELRTPLTAIRWSVQNLLDGIPESPSPKVREYLARIHDGSSHLSRMIKNLLDVTKIEAGKLEIFPERLRLAELIPACVQALTPVAAKKNIRIQAEKLNDLRVYADRDALQEILSNLIDNAIKYSPDGKTIYLNARRDETTDKVAISVRDEGAGIPPEKQVTIFEKFARLAQEKKAREKGLGLGLYIVKKLVEAQGGTIELESKEGAGSTFIFTLPIA
ncbi:MAG: ATP-binding protein [candidate division KSB1 bacterium]|nr:ATP-binding protein [candidate division KSB1 bacterium]MDZ7305070.1 ATP-binding protein [candidate division KSB1 bacterium]MDZ7313560.1 ATP-binding protein [candidate division KSB1 bacterium]